MRTKAEIISQLTNPGIIAIIRARSAAQVIPISEALLAGGVVAIEITMSTPDAIGAIRDASREFGERALIGVGTILKPFDCQQALDAGAQFVVSPICRTELIPLTHTAQKPIMLGSYTPTEAQIAHEAGSDFIKIFPADGLGVKYIKALRAPLPHLKIVPTGGVDLNTIADFFKAGCPAVGAGSSLVSKEILEKDDWPQLTKRATDFVKAAKTARGG
jgi:2-dehydro-3-deoxyphosphogluconate aldolase/(4S)-4-hydroxy-2-oxoglutarate aldolase